MEQNLTKDALLAIIAERLESWSEAHHARAMRMLDGEDCWAQMNLRDNYKSLADMARLAIKIAA